MNKIQENSKDPIVLKKKIQDLEKKLSNETSLHSQSTLRKQISELRDIYSSLLNLELPSIEISEIENLSEYNSNDSTVTDKGTPSHPKFRDISHLKIQSINCVDCLIENCSFIETEEIKCEGTLNIRNINNSAINARSNYVRISNSSNITLEVFTKTGIYLQDSTNITIIPITDPNNNCFRVFDFNSPTSSSNFLIKTFNEPPV